ncbi:MAG: phosphatase PAP2 family protein [Chloroflexi bacterium]|nr:phosphatase PAP2 family protein [Chloroflexota bacterium]
MAMEAMSIKQKCGFGLLLATLALLTYGALTTDRFSWDLTLTRWIQSVDVGPIANLNNRMGVMGVSGVVGVAVIAWLWLRGWRAEAAFVALVGVADLLNPLLRYLIGRPRPTPDLVDVYREVEPFSFPSGTAMHVIMFCGMLVYLSGYVLKPGRLRTAVRVLLIAYVPLMGVWVIERGCHWPSDVLGGYVYGAFFLVILIWGYRKYVAWRRRYPRNYVPREKLPALIQPLAWVVRVIT